MDFRCCCCNTLQEIVSRSPKFEMQESIDLVDVLIEVFLRGGFIYDYRIAE